MNRIRSLIANLSFFVCCLLAFLLIFEGSFATPAWLQVLGRMHPLLLHFPIAVLILYAVWVIVGKKPTSEAAPEQLQPDDLLLVGYFTAALSALMGLLLSKEGGYSADSLFWHKWAGASTAFVALAWFTFRKRWNSHAILSKAIPGGMVILITLAGHQGANITHGENFVLAPVTPKMDPKSVPFEEAIVFDHLVQPILEEKCMSCHNSRKAKGELVMESAETLRAGGKNGLLWDSLNYEASLLLERIHLPESTEEHMPPEGKTQLTDEEKDILEAWIQAGAPFESLVAETATNGPLYEIALSKFSENTSRAYAFEPAEQKVVESLNSFYRIVTPVAANSPALAVTFLSQEAFRGEQLKELSSIAGQVVEISLNKMPLKDEDLAYLSSFENLEVLQVNFTDISDEGISNLKGLSHLKELAVSGTAVSPEGITQLKGLESLKKVFIWNTSIDKTDIPGLLDDFPAVSFESGFDDEGTIIQLSAPVIASTNAFFSDPISVEVKHYLNGVTLRYTLDGSEPDSVDSQAYKENITLEENATVTVRAFKDGWIGSQAVSKTFLRSAIVPLEVSLLTAPNPKYKAKLDQSLFDRVKGTNIHTDGSWLGYQGEPMDVLVKLDGKPKKSVTLSTLNNTGGWIMPPASVEIWYGNDPKSLKLWKRERVQQPTKNLPVGPAFYTYELPEGSYSYLKLQIMPVAKLPAWHDAKGNPGWVFVDEILLN